MDRTSGCGLEGCRFDSYRGHMNLSDSVAQIPKVGPVYVKRLERMGIKTINDLLLYLPVKYDDFSKTKKIKDLKINEAICIKATIESIDNEVTYRRRVALTKASVKDSTGTILVTWFNQPYLVESLHKGDTIFLAGKVSSGKNGIYISNPIHQTTKTEPVHVGRIVPTYTETRGLTSRWLRYIINPLLKEFKNQFIEILPQEIIEEHDLLDINTAIQEIHFPSNKKLSEKAKQRFEFEELFLLELFVLNKKYEMSKLESTPIPINIKKMQKFTESLPFKLTDSQRKCAWQILKDLEKPRPMTRLLQGDVGSGKTMVAALAALNTADSDHQIAFMAPTEILSKQHFETLGKYLHGFNVNIGLLTSKTDKFISKKLKNQIIEISRKKLLENTNEGKINILVGTHSLIQDKVKFNNLGLVIVDEQHRFGVKQRAKLCKKQTAIPHLLSMTATPIPRTLALTVYGDLDLSLLDEMPMGKRKVETRIVKNKERAEAYKLVEEEIKKGKQVFVICPRIEEKETSEKDKSGWSDVKGVEQEFERLQKDIFPQFKILMMHGKLSSTEKNKIMKEFSKKKADILVSTSVIEVGIDIPNATLMIIEGAERFGLSQLHQFRGRIGRAGDQAYFLLFFNSGSKTVYARLKAIESIDNGLELAERDLKFRGPGQFLGTKQWGIPDFAMHALDDFSLVEKTRQAAKTILPQINYYPELKKRLKAFQDNIHLE